MSPSFYIYETVADYLLHYPSNTPEDYEMPVEHIILKSSDMIRIIVPYETHGPQPKPRAKASVDVMLGGHEQYLQFWEEDDEVVAKAYYRPKDDQIVLESINYKFLKKCDRFIGTRPVKKFWKRKFDIHPKYMFFDVGRNRINFITSKSNTLSAVSE